MLRLCLLLLLVSFSPIQTQSGKVLRIIDGDTFELQLASGIKRIRMFGIDAPEHGQPFNKKSKEFLSTLIAGKTVTIKVNRLDQYGRTVADVYIGSKWINQELVAAGYAWMYRDFTSDSRLEMAESTAKRAKRGLWSDPEPQPPWEYRKLLRQNRSR